MSLIKYNLFTIETNLGINDLINFLETFCRCDDQIVSVIKDFYRDPETREYYENGKKLAILDEELFKVVKTHISIEKYKIGREHYANKNSSVMHFYYPLSKDYDNNKLLSKKMECLSSFGIVSRNDWYIHKNEGICEFSTNVDAKTRIILKLILDSPSDFRVSWCRLKLFQKIEKHF